MGLNESDIAGLVTNDILIRHIDAILYENVQPRDFLNIVRNEKVLIFSFQFTWHRESVFVCTNAHGLLEEAQSRSKETKEFIGCSTRMSNLVFTMFSNYKYVSLLTQWLLSVATNR
jgi:hypothetical protein